MNIMRTTRFSFRTFMTEVACVLTMMLFMLHTTYAATVAFSVEVPSTTVVVGDTVEIKDGALKGTIGVLKEISEDLKKVTVVANMFGRDTPFELDAKDIRLADK